MSNSTSVIHYSAEVFTQQKQVTQLCHFLLHPHAGHYNYPRNCLDALNRGYNVSGVYRILPDSGKPFDVYCDQVTDGGGWTVFQRRQDGFENFQRNRVEYIRGFGDYRGEHWLGLEKIYRLTKWADFEPELRVDLMDFTNDTRFEHYNKFYVSGPPAYTLYVSDYSGTAGNSLTYHSGRGFSTPDYDVDGSSGSCAITNQGAWWFNNCHYSHLNGVYYYGTSSSSKGIIWRAWRGSSYSLKRTEMKIRPSRLTWN